MSDIHHPPIRDASDDPLPNRGDSEDTFSTVREDVFETVVENNPNVCPRCYHRHKTREERPNERLNEKSAQRSSFVRYEIPPPEPDEQFTWKLDWRYYRTDQLTDRVAYDDVPDETGGGEYPSIEGGHERYCTNCGIVNPSADTSKTKLEALRAADTLSRTLREYAIPHDWRYLLDAVAALKTISPLADKDHTIFRIVTEEAVELAERDITETTFTPDS